MTQDCASIAYCLAATLPVRVKAMDLLQLPVIVRIMASGGRYGLRSQKHEASLGKHYNQVIAV